MDYCHLAMIRYYGPIEYYIKVLQYFAKISITSGVNNWHSVLYGVELWSGVIASSFVLSSKMY